MMAHVPSGVGGRVSLAPYSEIGHTLAYPATPLEGLPTGWATPLGRTIP